MDSSKNMTFWEELALAFLGSALAVAGGRAMTWLFDEKKKDEDEEVAEDEEIVCPACGGSGVLIVRIKHRKKP